MPTYEYVCPAGHEFEKFQKMTDKPRAKCPVCGKPAIRQISGGAGLVFRGSGFYITDYGKDGKGPRKAPEGEKGGEASTAKSDTSDTKDSSTPAKTEPKASETKSKAKKAAE